jgi:hypothetical protein
MMRVYDIRSFMKLAGLAVALAAVVPAYGCKSSPAAGGRDTGTSGKDGGPGGGAFQITTASLMDGNVGTAYSDKIAAMNGTPPYTFMLASGSALPNGLTLSSDGSVSGTPLVAGSSRLDVVAVDSASPQNMASATISITIKPAAGSALSIVTTSLPDGAVGTAYEATVTATGGTTPYVFSIASGSPPNGIALSTDGKLTGTASVAGTATFTIEVTDASSPSQSATAVFTLTIKPAQGNALTITTTMLPDGKINMAYTATLAASGGTAPYTWSLSAGTGLPSGLSLGANGIISGTPTEAGQKTFTVQVMDSATPAQSSTTELAISIQPTTGTALAITTVALPNGTVGQAYTAMVGATGGTTPYSFTVASGALPSGLALSPLGAVSGTPSQAGTFSFVLQATDASMPAQVATKSFSVTIAMTGNTHPLVVTTSALPAATDGVAYSAMLTASGGMTPYQWALGPGSALPPGLSISATGQISGTPSVPGRYSFTVVVADGSMPEETASAALSITVAAPPGDTLRILTTGLPDAHQGTAYRVQLIAAGGTPPYTWSIAWGALPRGLTLSPQGLISGTASVAGSFMFDAEVQDSAAPPLAAEATFTLNVLPPGTQVLTITTAVLPNGITGAAYNAQLAANGGTPPYTWTISAGMLPIGLSLSTGGAITGMPTSAGAFTFTVRVADSGTQLMQTAERQFAIIVFSNPNGLQIVNPTLPNGQVGAAYTANILVAGGTPPYMLSVSQGSLPPGLALSSTDHTISGSPTTSGVYTFTLEAKDSAMPPATVQHTYTVTIANSGSAVQILTMFLPPAIVGRAYSATLVAFRGTQPYTWSIAQGVLPAGLALASNGTISGTPAARGISQFTVQVVDSSMPPGMAERQLLIDVR